MKTFPAWLLLAVAAPTWAGVGACREEALEGVASFKAPPDTYLQTPVEITIAMKFRGDGTMEEIAVVDSSRNRDLDRAALEMIRHANLSDACLQTSRGRVDIVFRAAPQLPDAIAPSMRIIRVDHANH
ncbi:MAG: hypothetical protein QM795_11575 [Pseudoxanthomonas sp.]